MSGRIARGWAMARASFAVLQAHPRLLLLPALSAAAAIGAFGAIFGVFMVEAGSLQGAAKLIKSLEQAWTSHRVVMLLVAGAAGCVFTSLSLYFNAALVFCVLRAFNGQAPSIREGLATAAGRLPQIIGWAFVAVVVGGIISMIQQTLKDKLGFLGSLLGGLLDFAWATITYFVLPVLVVEGVGPINAVKRSSSILKQTWGETATGSVGFGLVGFLLTIPALFMIALGVLLAVNSGIGGIAVVMFALAFAYFIAVATVMGTLGTVFQTGLYVYATTGKAPFDEPLLKMAFQPKAAK